MTPAFVPICTIIAGPNGAGKSTIVQELAPPGEVVNADDYARRLKPQDVAAASSAAGRQVLVRLEELIRDRQSFNYETTLSSNQSLKLIETARAAGFRVELALVLLRTRDLHVARVRTRVANGGHDIPVSTILRRYDRTLANFPEAVALADQVIVYDNTAGRPTTLCRIDRRVIVFSALDPVDFFHVRIATLIGQGLEVSASAVFAARDQGN